MSKLKMGVFCFSIDVELLWGKQDLDYRKLIPSVEKEREVIEQLLDLCKNYKISFTWAIVGKLFQENHDQLWTGIDIVENIKKTGSQEIGSHSFSHRAFGEPSCTEEIAESEIRESVQSVKKFDMQLKSFVFPKNSIAYLRLLKKYGFSSFRGKQSNIFPEENLLHHMAKAFDLFFPSSPPVYNQCIWEEGLVNIPASFHFLSNRGIRKFIPKGTRFKKAKKGIDRAIQEKKIFHLWTHPLDLVDKQGVLLDELKKIILYAIKKRDEGLLTIKTMENIAEKCYE